jgi:leader peptidase (prepilin peptidase)/N-methyltransferase
MSVINFLASHMLAFVLCALLIGLLVGSFLNVVIYRLPKMMQCDWREQAREILELPAGPETETFNLVLPNSQCPHCAHEIKPWENIPVISYLFLRGKCSSCKASISLRYPLVELTCGLLSAYIA